MKKFANIGFITALFTILLIMINLDVDFGWISVLILSAIVMLYVVSYAKQHKYGFQKCCKAILSIFIILLILVGLYALMLIIAKVLINTSKDNLPYFAASFIYMVFLNTSPFYLLSEPVQKLFILIDTTLIYFESSLHNKLIKLGFDFIYSRLRPYFFSVIEITEVLSILPMTTIIYAFYFWLLLCSKGQEYGFFSSITNPIISSIVKSNELMIFLMIAYNRIKDAHSKEDGDFEKLSAALFKEKG